MKFVTTFHHITNWYWYPHWFEGYDTADSAYTGLYGPLHNQKNLPEIWWHDQINIKSLKKLYRSEIRNIRMLGTDSELDWSMNKNGLTIKTPEKRPCNHAYEFKIERN